MRVGAACANMSILLTGFEQLVPVDITPIDHGAIVIENGKIIWIGKANQAPEASETYHYPGCIALPGLIDSHTHPVFAGNRADEFEMRLAGKTYQEIAQAGGGIMKTVRETREADFDTLKNLTRKRLETSMSFGVTTIECKSGYGLTTESELKSLQVLKSLQDELPMDIISTFMGAHDIPHPGYVDLLCNEMIPAVAGLAEFNDVFCETGYFSVEESRRILETGLKYGLKPRIHAEEFSDLEGAMMACDIGALSADHLLHLSDKGIQRMAQSETVATLLPGTAFCLRMKDYAPARKLLDAGVTVALATDFNPGSNTSPNLQLIMTLGCLQMGMHPHEVIQAVTLNAAKALGRSHDRGSLSAGKRADIAIFGVSSYQELLYHYGVNYLSGLWVEGTKLF